MTPRMAELRIAREADDQIRAVETWWHENRPGAPLLFAHELAEALELLTHAQEIGARYGDHGGGTVRRILLGRCRYHVYFSYDAAANVVEVRAVWHAVRGEGPTLG